MIFVWLFLAGATVQGQTYIDFGPKIMFGPNIINSKSAFSSSKYSHNLNSIGWAGGFKFAFDFNLNFAIGSEILYNSFKQQFDVVETDLADVEHSYSKTIKYTSIDIPVFARYNFEDMRYVEAGVVFSNIKPVSETIEGPYTIMATGLNPEDYYADKNTGFMFGIGGYVWGAGNFGMSGGLRFRYNFGDFVKEGNTEAPNQPIYALDADVTNTTNPWSVMLVFEFNYDMQFYFAKHSCSGRRKVMIGNKF